LKGAKEKMRSNQYLTNEIINNIEQYKDIVYYLAATLLSNKYDVDEVFQKVLLRYIRKKPDFENEEQKKGWFIRATINYCKKDWKSSGKVNTQKLDKEIAK